ncbi:zinc finger protein 281-like isoform X1 [Tachysurus ichikawai]
MPQLLTMATRVPVERVSVSSRDPSSFFFFLPIVPRAESRWRSAAVAGEQCLDSEDRNKRPSWAVKKTSTARVSGGHELVSERKEKRVLCGSLWFNGQDGVKKRCWGQTTKRERL